MSARLNRSIDMRVLHLSDVTDTITGAGQIVKFTTSANLTNTPSATYNSTLGQVTLPDVQCVLRAGLEYNKSAGSNSAYFIDVQWYDVTNTQYIGSKARVKGYRPDIYYTAYDLTCDEEAIAVAQNVIVECRIITLQVSNQVLILDNAATYSGESRALIMEYHD
jgi:hypothetical protein